LYTKFQLHNFAQLQTPVDDVFCFGVISRLEPFQQVGQKARANICVWACLQPKTQFGVHYLPRAPQEANTYTHVFVSAERFRITRGFARGPGRYHAEQTTAGCAIKHTSRNSNTRTKYPHSIAAAACDQIHFHSLAKLIMRTAKFYLLDSLVRLVCLFAGDNARATQFHESKSVPWFCFQIGESGSKSTLKPKTFICWFKINYGFRPFWLHFTKTVGIHN
jgi:hypothetical protein